MPLLTDEERDRWLKREKRKQRFISILFSLAGGILMFIFLRYVMNPLLGLN